ncbi:DMT family transporter [Roseobacter sp. MH60115]|uniref:DMT family transporter n=1 Tax=Roseobacter sp. MH60115 TaxID=2785324 RepID=UPI0018A2E9BF|nr:DMT family transporter [Roseobacter sp. MH60115]
MADSTHENRALGPILAIVASVAALSLGDAVIKATGLSLPLWQMYVLRSALVLPLLWWLARRQGPVKLFAPLWILVRCTLLVIMWLSYYASLPQMPLSLAAAAYYTGPLFIIALSAGVAQRWPARRAILAITCGFVGVLMIIRPENSNFEIATLFPVIAAFLYACAMVLTSAKCSKDSPFVLALALNVAFIVTGVLLGLFSGYKESLILGPWQPLDLALFGTIAILAVLILIGSVGAAYAYQKGQPTTVATFDYSYLMFSLLWGALFFNELPGTISLIGIFVIAWAGFLALPSKVCGKK